MTITKANVIKFFGDRDNPRSYRQAQYDFDTIRVHSREVIESARHEKRLNGIFTRLYKKGIIKKLEDGKYTSA